MSKVPSLHPSLTAAVLRYREIRSFNPVKFIQEACELLNNYCMKYSIKTCVINLSGGIDSAVVFALAARSKEVAGSVIENIIPIAQPICSSDWALSRAELIAKKINIKIKIINQTEEHALLTRKIEEEVGVVGGDFARGQMRSYMRTPVAFYIAQLFSQKNNAGAIVLGTGNKDEDGYLGYFCKAGDGVVDVQIISSLHKSEVFLVAKELALPEEVISAPPSADLWENQTDEEELGLPYDFVELFTGWYLPLQETQKKEFIASLPPEAKVQFEEMANRCESIHRRNAHKLNGPINLC